MLKSMKKVSAICISVALITALAAVNVFAATNNVSIKTLSNVPPGTLLYEQGTFSSQGIVVNGGADGTDLVISVGDRVPVYGQMQLTLTNGTWDFGGDSGAAAQAQALYDGGAGLAGIDDSAISGAVDGIINGGDWNGDAFKGAATVGDGTYAAANGTALSADYDIGRGVYTNFPVRNLGGSINMSSILGTYYCYNQILAVLGGSTSPTVVEVPYRLDIYGDSSALLTILPVVDGDASNGGNGGYYQSGVSCTYEIHIPIVALTGTD
ncbi:MAG: hypothetical protein FWF44_12300, partial [Defluviitaleaceae bacterium]|nr:hypothetical protein [Defluviitaleaceae bacterium]